MRDAADGLRRVDPGYRQQRGKIRFSSTEVLHITVAIVVLSAAFAIVFRGSHLDSDPTRNLMLIIGMSFLLVICSFLFHEFGHKFVAQRYNLWSEFRMWAAGLVLALFISYFGFLFAAPGAVYIQGNIDKDTYGKISLAGPSVNLVIAAVAIAVVFSLTPGTLAYVIFQMLAFLNSWFGLFNMIPIPPFDGSKIFAWNKSVYLAALAIGVIEFAIVMLYIMY